jgi:hypothetical protein
MPHENPHSNRRHFLATTAASISMLASRLPARAGPASDRPPLQLGLVTYQWGKDVPLAELLEVCQRTRFAANRQTQGLHGPGIHRLVAARRRGDPNRHPGGNGRKSQRVRPSLVEPAGNSHEPRQIVMLGSELIEGVAVTFTPASGGGTQALGTAQADGSYSPSAFRNAKPGSGGGETAADEANSDSVSYSQKPTAIRRPPG